ncbi:class I SAM-dependent methyltransferase [Nocardioides acrostichi]|uniref:Methyltransferase domain-containing protein n=1 Tax=Nocardioides acrostichi TaxID=2784339 RepID=A0A930V082_9ACTN|nr:methyltransferase domain-containing protein [Nocardioides acrostichi]MBF4162280.1 methyltransferase domain-containing protein [Nocardioides acrostichi]
MAGGWGAAGQAQAYADTCAVLCAGAHDAVLAALDVRPGERVVDAGAGDGRLSARLVDAGAHVTAVDPDPGMLALVAGNAPGAVRVEAALPELPLASAVVDAVVACFVVNHLPDPRAGVAELARLVRPGGRVVVAIWPSEASAQTRLWAAALARAEIDGPPGPRLPAHLDFERTVAGTASLLHESGLVEVTSHSVEWTYEADRDALWRAASAGIGGIGTTVARLDDAQRHRLRTAYRVLVADHVVGNRLRLRTTAVLATGQVVGDTF